MRFCQAFMSELYRHIGADTDVPAGDIGVGAREIGYLFGQYKRLANQFTSVLTGKGMTYGGSLIRPEATGYGCVYFAEEMLKRRDLRIDGRRVAISGSGNVAQYAARKVMDLGGKVISLSDSEGTLFCEAGLTDEQWDALMELKNVKRGRISEMASLYGLEFRKGQTPWSLPCDIALPCATQNELNAEDARTLLQNGCICVAEGANMPTTLEAVDIFPKRASSMRRAKPPTQVAWRFRAWKCRRTPCACYGLPVRWTASCTTSCSRSITLACTTAKKPMAPSTTSRAPTSPASSRSPMPCWPRVWFKSHH